MTGKRILILVTLFLGVGCSTEPQEEAPQASGSQPSATEMNQACTEPPGHPMLPDGSYPPGRPYAPPEEGLIPDEETAVKVGRAILIPIFGEETIADESPFRGCLKGDM